MILQCVTPQAALVFLRLNSCNTLNTVSYHEWCMNGSAFTRSRTHTCFSLACGLARCSARCVASWLVTGERFCGFSPSNLCGPCFQVTSVVWFLARNLSTEVLEPSRVLWLEKHLRENHSHNRLVTSRTSCHDRRLKTANRRADQLSALKRLDPSFHRRGFALQRLPCVRTSVRLEPMPLRRSSVCARTL